MSAPDASLQGQTRGWMRQWATGGIDRGEKGGVGNSVWGIFCTKSVGVSWGLAVSVAFWSADGHQSAATMGGEGASNLRIPGPSCRWTQRFDPTCIHSVEGPEIAHELTVLDGFLCSCLETEGP